jgi:hypothetical protein
VHSKKGLFPLFSVSDEDWLRIATGCDDDDKEEEKGVDEKGVLCFGSTHAGVVGGVGVGRKMPSSPAAPP